MGSGLDADQGVTDPTPSRLPFLYLHTVSLVSVSFPSSLLRVSGISPVQCKLHTDLLTSSFAPLSARSDSQCIRIMGVEVRVGHMQEFKMQILRPCPDLVNDTIQVGSGSLYF